MIAATQPQRGRIRIGMTVPGAIGISLVVLIVGLTILAPSISPFSPSDQDLYNLYAAPNLNSAHILGTDAIGQDLLSRILYGGRMPLLIAGSACLLSAIVGVGLGVLAGARGGWIDQFLGRLADIQLAMPSIILALVLLAFAGVNLINLVIVITLATWPSQFRLTRAHAMSLRRQNFIEAAEMGGGSTGQIILRHYLPNVMPLAIVTTTLNLSTSLLLEASLSYLGLGVQPPTPDWGQMVAAGQSQLGAAWWLSVAPGVMLMLLILGIQLSGDWLAGRLSVRGMIRFQGWKKS
ncbi:MULTISPECIES: ABC transporter permease subunit [Chelativorans]|uniref:Binding-protein-dependent transport systems inner membrane component n=1 Tax=Chelativorans sp. (strain BNC1) TaxID=266779 RepID=Q11BW8_CHESB